MSEHYSTDGAICPYCGHLERATLLTSQTNFTSYRRSNSRKYLNSCLPWPMVWIVIGLCIL